MAGMVESVGRGAHWNARSDPACSVSLAKRIEVAKLYHFESDRRRLFRTYPETRIHFLESWPGRKHHLCATQRSQVLKIFFSLKQTASTQSEPEANGHP